MVFKCWLKSTNKVDILDLNIEIESKSCHLKSLALLLSNQNSNRDFDKIKLFVIVTDVYILKNILSYVSIIMM